jgi:predicted dehydrogenase
MIPAVSRREFIRSASAASVASLAFPSVLKSQGAASLRPGQRLNVACVGVGGQGGTAVQAMSGENLVAFCDVDDTRAAEVYRKYPHVRRFRDYRQMLDRMGPEIDAVTVSTPDHMHFPIARAAIQLGKHVFCEKPMTHTIWEARELARAAAEQKVATVMGIQGHAYEGMRLLKEWLDAGMVGEVREVHSWTDRPIWPQGVRAPDHTKCIPVVPETLDWDRWLGVAAERPYDPAYAPFTWRGYWDFGTGALGDMACHLMDGVFWAMGLDAPTRVEAVSSGMTDVSAPTASLITYHFPATGKQGAFKWHWYDGGLLPMLPDAWASSSELPDNGTLVVGRKLTVYADSNYRSARIVPEAKMRELQGSLPAKTIPRLTGDHFAEWLTACKGGPAAGADFAYSGRLTEMVLLGNVAVRARRPIEWDSPSLRVTNVLDANQFVTKPYRRGFGV